jgi:hypothetical protein
MMKPRIRTYEIMGLLVVFLAAVLLVACTTTEQARRGGDVLGFSHTEDLSGEVCFAGTAVINTPIGPLTYCIMQGRLGTDEALEIDDLNSIDFTDANVFNGVTANDPDYPPVGGATFIDWDSLTLSNVTEEILGSVENNRILDTVANDDFTMLRPQAKSCLNDGSVVPKEDFTQSYVANNEEYIYMAQERRTNNGNSVYYWLLTQNPPYVNPNSPDCGAQTRGQLLFDLTPGDVEVIVNFPDSSDPTGGAVFFRKFVSISNAPGLLADEAVFAPGWDDRPEAIPNFAMNEVEFPHDGDDGLPHWGGLDKRGNPIPQDGNTYAAASFAEWAIDLSEVFGVGEPICGKRLYFTGLSRASTGKVGDLTEPSALKDLVGPKLYSFGEITAIANVTGNCDLTFDYEVTAVGLDGETPIPEENLTCLWSCTAPFANIGGPYDANACSGSGTLDYPSIVNCTVTVDDSDSGCTDSDGGSDSVLTGINASIAPTPTFLNCTVPGTGTTGFDNGTISDGINYTATATGGSGNYSYNWLVTGPSEIVCGNSASCLVDIPDNNFCARTSVKVVVDDDDPRCPGVDSEVEEVSKSTSVIATDN